MIRSPRLLPLVALVVALLSSSAPASAWSRAASPSVPTPARRRIRRPPFEVDPKWPALPPQWTLGQVTGVAVDASDHVWVLHRPWSLTDDEKAQNPEAPCCTAAPPVLEFDADGRYLRGWGGPGAGYEWPEDEHAIHVDHKRNVWITSAGGPRLAGGKENQILKFTSDGTFLLQIGRRGMSQGSLDTANVNNAADLQVDPATNELYVADGYVNRRVIVFDADTGAFKRMWGAYGKPPDDAAPRTASYDGPPPAAVHPGPRHPRLARRQGLRRRPAQQPHAGVHDRGAVRARDLHRAPDPAARHGVLDRLLAGPRTARALLRRRRQRPGAPLRSGDAEGDRRRSAASAATPASSSSSTRWPPIRAATSTRRKSGPGGGCRSS